MKTKRILATLILPLTLLGSCAQRSPKAPSPSPASQTAAASAHPDYCPHCARRLSDPPANPTYGPAAYEDHTPPRPLSTQPPPTTSAVPPAAAAHAPGTAATTPVAPPYGSVSPAAKPPPQLSVDADGSRYYIVAPGDSLWKIAKTFGVKIDAIKSANALESDVVVVGQKLEIP